MIEKEKLLPSKEEQAVQDDLEQNLLLESILKTEEGDLGNIDLDH